MAEVLPGTVADRRAEPSRPPAGPSGAAPTATARPGAGLTAPALIILATVAILEGYRWLDLIRLSPPRPTMVLYVVLVAPAVFVLTRRRRPSRTMAVARVVARVAAVAVVACGVLAALSGWAVADRLLGGASLVVAGAALVLVWRAELRRR
jgi:hypothetical protein